MDTLFQDDAPETPEAPDPAPVAPEPKQEPTKPAVEVPKLGDDLDGLLKPKPKPEEKKPAAEDETAKLKTPKALREAYDRLKVEREERDKRITELEIAVQKAADEGRTKAESTLQAKLDEIIKERDEYATKVNYLDYRESREFKEKYEAPYKDAWKRAAEEIDGLEITVGDVTRPAKTEDLVQIFNLPTAQARLRAKELFPDAAADIMRHRAEILRISQESQNAQNEWREKGSQLRASEQAEIENARKSFATEIDTRVRELAEVAPEIFGDKFDDEAKPYVEKAQKMLDIALGRAQLPSGMTPQEIVKTRARFTGDVVARVRQFPALLLKNQKMTAELEELRAKLKDFQKSEPSTDPATDTKSTTNDPLDFAAHIDSL